MKLLIINGSPRKNGNTDKIVSIAKDILEKSGTNAETLNLRAIEMTLPDGCTECANSESCPNMNDQFEKEILPTLIKYDGYIFASPTYDDNVTPLMKIFVDRIVSFCHEDRMYLRDKKIGLITHGMAGADSWKIPITWVKSVCGFHEATFIGSFTCKSNAEPNTAVIDDKKLEVFLKQFR